MKESCIKKLKKFVKKNDLKIITWTSRFKELKIIVIFENELNERITKIYEFKSATNYSRFNKQLRRVYNGSS